MSNIFEEKNIPKAVLRLGIPSMLGQLTTLIYNLADTYFVSLTREAPQIAAVTLCTPILLIIMSVACVFGMGGSSVIARMIGEGRKKEAANCFDFCTWAMLASSVVVMVIGLLFTKQIAGFTGADAANIGYTCDYLRWIFIGAPFIMLSNGLVHSLRSVGLIREATIGLAIGNGVNMIFDWIFIVPVGIGAKGAAMATSFGFVCATAYYIYSVFRRKRNGNEYVKLSPVGMKLGENMIPNVVKIGIPGALITVLLSVSNIVLNNFIGIYGSDAVASYGIAYKIDLFPIMLSVGLSMGVAPLLGYYYGKGDAKRLSSAVKTATVYGLMLGAAFTLILFTAARPLATVFLKEEALISLTALFLRLLCFHAPLLGIINMVTSYFQALGKATSSLIITVLRNVALFIPGVVLFNHFFGLNGVILNQLMVEAVLTIICSLLYLRNRPGKLLHTVKEPVRKLIAASDVS